jgi:hypothetical protein
MGLETAKNTTTGGDSFCFMEFSRETTATNGVPLIISRGEFPLTDVVARIIDLDKRTKTSFPTPADMTAGDIIYRIGDIPVKAGSVMQDLLIPISGSSQNFRMSLAQRTGCGLKICCVVMLMGWSRRQLKLRELTG